MAKRTHRAGVFRDPGPFHTRTSSSPSSRRPFPCSDEVCSAKEDGERPMGINPGAYGAAE